MTAEVAEASKGGRRGRRREEGENIYHGRCRRCHFFGWRGMV